MKKYLFAPLFAAAGFLLAASTGPVLAAHTDGAVRITGLGSHDGEFCNSDRGLLLRDPNGTVILYDAGRTGVDHPLLGEGEVGEFIDVVLLSSVHGDHLGNQKTDNPNSGTCIRADRTTITPNANTTDIAAAKDAHVFVGGEMSSFLGARLLAMGEVANEGGAHTHTLRQGGEVTEGGVKFSVVMAVHSNGVSPSFLTEDNLLSNKGGNDPKGLTQHTLAEHLAANGLTAYVGPDHGYIIKFTNGLVVYLTGDTGQTSDMKTIVHDFYAPHLAIVNMGGTFSMGPVEAAWAVDNLIQPASVILTHSNQESTVGGAIKAGSKMEKFTDLSTTQAHVPNTGNTMFFDGHGTCIGVNCQPDNTAVAP